MEQLAVECESYDDLASAALIRQRVSRGNFLEAAAVYKTCDSISEGERWKGLAAPFRRTFVDEEIQRLVPLVGLGFTALVTTNYDRSLHEACVKAQLGWVTPVERGDDSLRGASFKSDLFIARIHGRAEQPSRMIVDKQDYDNLDNDQTYLDFVLHLLKSRSCLFVGFSFVDPAINKILSLYETRFGPEFNALHTALVPSDAVDLAARLGKVNIRTVTYDPSDEHVALWRAVREAYDAKKRIEHEYVGPVVSATGPQTSIHRYMAFAYAQIQSSPKRKSLIEMVQDGIVLAALTEAPNNISAEGDVTNTVRSALGLSEAEAAEVVSESVTRLERRNQAVRDEGVIGLGDPLPNPLRGDLECLATSVLDRMRVREQVKISQDDQRAAEAILESVFMSRAWDLAAHYAGSSSGWGVDLANVISQLVASEARRRTLSSPGALERAVYSLITTPDGSESNLLVSVGRAAFGVQLVLATPRQALFRKYSLPERVYLDASVLMPAIVEGHPLRPVYVDSLRLLSEASERAGIPLRVSVGNQFLNEIVSHRELAEDLVNELGLEDPEKLKQHISFYGATNTNVFVAAYGSFTRSRGRTHFREFLRQIAPYGTELELSRHLRSLAIETEPMDFETRNNHVFVEVYNQLYEGYEQISETKARKKKILIMHEGEQLAQLRVDQDKGVRSIFVTADNALRRAIQRDVRLHRYLSSTVSQLGLASLVDVMVGLETDNRSLARLVWATQRSDEEQTIFEYLVRLGIQNYEEGMAMEMQQAAQFVAERAAHTAERQRVPLFGKDAEDVARTAEFLDRYEEMFFRHWREAIDKRERSNERAQRKSAL